MADSASPQQAQIPVAPQPQFRSPIPTAGQWATLILILAVAAFVRFWQIGAVSLWMDEIWTIELSMGRGSIHDRLPTGVIQTQQLDLTSIASAEPWWHVWTNMVGVPYPPLYHLLLRGWMEIFGSGPAAARSLSAVASLLAVVVLFDVCRLLHGTRIALWAAAIMAISITSIEYAQEARSYPTLILMGLCCCDALVRIEKMGAAPTRLAALAICVAALPLIHYFTVAAIFALCVYAMLRLRGTQRRRTLTAFVVAAALVAVLWGPWLVPQLRSVPTLNPDFMQEHIGEHVSQTLNGAISLPAQFLFGQTVAWSMPPIALRLVAALTIAIPLIRLRRRRDLLLWVLWIYAILGFLVAYDLARDTMVTRIIHYSLLASPAVCAIVAAFDWPRRPIIRDWLPLMVLLLAAMLVARRVRDGEGAIQQWRELVVQIDQAAKPDELLVFSGADAWVSPGFDYVAFKYYVPSSNRPWLIVNHPIDQALMAQMRKYPSLWLVGTRPEDARSAMPGWRLGPPYIETTATTACHMIRVDAHAQAGYRGIVADGYHPSGAAAALHDD